MERNWRIEVFEGLVRNFKNLNENWIEYGGDKTYTFDEFESQVYGMAAINLEDFVEIIPEDVWVACETCSLSMCGELKELLGLALAACKVYWKWGN